MRRTWFGSISTGGPATGRQNPSMPVPAKITETERGAVTGTLLRPLLRMILGGWVAAESLPRDSIAALHWRSGHRQIKTGAGGGTENRRKRPARDEGVPEVAVYQLTKLFSRLSGAELRPRQRETGRWALIGGRGTRSRRKTEKERRANKQ